MGRTGGTVGRADGARRTRTAALALAGFALFDLGQLFARPRRTQIAGSLDVTLSACEALACLAVLAAALAASRRGASGRSARVRASDLAVLGATGACALGMLVVVTAPASPGILSAYAGCALLGLGFGFGYTAWLLSFCRLARADGAGGGPGSEAAPSVAVLPVVSLVASRSAALAVRLAVGEGAWTVVGLACLAASLVALAALGRRLAEGHRERGNGAGGEGPGAGPGAARPPLRHALPALLGAGLFSLLFGLMTQMRNGLGAWTPLPDYLSSLITVAATLVLAVWVARSGRRLSIESVFLVTLPLIAAVMVAVPLLWTQLSDVADALVKSFFSFYLAALFVYTIQAEAARGAAVGPDEALPALAMATVWTGAAAGSAVGLATVRLMDGTALAGVFLAATWACMLAAVVYARSKGGAGAAGPDGGGRAPSADAASPTQPAATGGPAVVYVDMDDRRVRLLGERFGLSDRERDVVRLLVKGRSASRIAAELYISENTVKTHMQNVYGKLGIHTKQELLDKVSSVEPPEGDEA